MCSTSCSSSLFEKGRLRPGIYKIQNLYSETFLDIHEHSKQVCCRPARDLGDGRGLWEIKSFGAGHTVQRVDPGKPEQFCTPTNGLNDGIALFVNAYPAAWRIEVIDDKVHHGFEYFFLGPTKRTWDLAGGRKEDGTKVQFYDEQGLAWQRWKLIPVDVQGTAPTLPQSSLRIPGLGSPPPYNQTEEVPEQPSTRTQHTAESERDDFGTIVTEVTVVTTRKKYRVTDD